MRTPTKLLKYRIEKAREIYTEGVYREKFLCSTTSWSEANLIKAGLDMAARWKDFTESDIYFSMRQTKHGKALVKAMSKRVYTICKRPNA